MRFFVALLICISAPAQDARQIVLKSLDANDANSRIAKNYTFVERIEQRDLDDAGRLKKRDSRTYDVTLLEGSPYRRLLQRDDAPLLPAEEAKEREKLERSIAQRKKETPGERSRRLADWEAKRKKQQEEFRQLLDAFDPKLAGEQILEGRPVYVIEMLPHPGYRPRGGVTRLYPRLKGCLWIDKTGHEWVKAEAEAIDTLSLGWIVARVYKGTHFVFEQSRVNNEVWMPKHVIVAYSARLALFKRLRGELEISTTSFRKFQADSRIIGISEQPQ